VADTGIGLAPDEIEKLFQPFVQADTSSSRKFGGTGLGLAISRQLVELMGGTIQVTSTEGLGTRVTVTLSAERANALREEAAASEQAPLTVYAPAGTQLLIVDDHPVNLAMLQRQLRVLGLEADTAASGKDALAKWRRKGHNLVITDLQMPEMDGYAFARAIRAEQDQSSKPTVVAFTANTHREALDHCIEAGMDDYLTKPTELVTLREKLARWLGAEAGLRAAPAPASARASRDMPIDRARIRELTGGGEGLAGVLSQVEAAARADIAMLQDALAASDGAAIRRAAHRIKGSALMIGAKHLAAAAIRLEHAPDSLDTPELRSAVQALIDELKSVLAATRADRDAAAA
jgi:two-component system, NarL family, sensor histidine kinase EvgS